VRRDVDSFWLAVYDSQVPGIGSRRVTRCSAFAPQADVIAFERASPALLASLPPGRRLIRCARSVRRRPAKARR
jgi:hypothetical protein